MASTLELAQGLKKQGYTAGVVAQKMVVEHGMTPEAANALVGPLYGKTLGTGRTDLVLGVGLIALGVMSVGLLVVNRDHLWDVEGPQGPFGYQEPKEGPFAFLLLTGLFFVWGTKRLLAAAAKRARSRSTS
jgi:hypothetical protein